MSIVFSWHSLGSNATYSIHKIKRVLLNQRELFIYPDLIVKNREVSSEGPMP
jgi:hypothetical protein